MKDLQIKERKQKIIATNRKARHDFEILQTIEAGVVLQGTEVKSLRAGMCSIQDAYASFSNPNSNDLYLINFHISPYKNASFANHEPKRTRKLLLHWRQAVKLKIVVSERGYTIIPLTIYFSGAFVKVEIALVRAKKKYDKREATKKRETEIEIRRRYR